ncbi:rhophilin-2-like [Scleropages formosus]|uniref:Rhophilin-2-like n=1 Tax=Scleropages formosus TaxID=113540 RepID=A0A0P7TUJ9_SCLFO|nr:rhophilin-2-like [Scleropages formosus]
MVLRHPGLHGNRTVVLAFTKGCDPLARSGRSRLQKERVRLNQQIVRQMRMRAGAENLLRATTNTKVHDVVLLELSFMNSTLQLLMEQLEALNSSIEVYQSSQNPNSTPLIALGLKETSEIDFSGPLKTIIQEHYGEDESRFEDEICDLMDLRQACRTPSRSEAGVELLSRYFSHLDLLEKRFFPPAQHTGIFFTWYDAFTGVPICQQNISLEKASILFNMAALYTQVGARCERQSRSGLKEAVTAFQRAAGVLNHLKEMFPHTTSYDMSPRTLSTLVCLMLAQAQECLLEQVALSVIRSDFLSLVRLAQEAAKVAERYDQVHQSMVHVPRKDLAPGFWSSMVQLKSTHFHALAHYFVAVLLMDHKLSSGTELAKQENALLQMFAAVPEGHPPGSLLSDQKLRQDVGRAHLHRALKDHEKALWLCTQCQHLRRFDTLLGILQACRNSSAEKLFHSGFDGDIVHGRDPPDVVPKADYEAQLEQLILTKLEVKDLFRKLGPLSVFSARQRWTAPRSVQLRPGSQGLGFSLRGDGPAQVQALQHLSPAAVAGLQEGDYVVAVAGEDTRWRSANDTLTLLQNLHHESIEMQVISMMDSVISTVPNKSATYCGKTYSMICLALHYQDSSYKPGKDSKKTPFFSWAAKTKRKSSSLPSMHCIRTMGSQALLASSAAAR